nr:hypothetical protein [uncultured Roseococcus sp.]
MRVTLIDGVQSTRMALPNPGAAFDLSVGRGVAVSGRGWKRKIPRFGMQQERRLAEAARDGLFSLAAILRDWHNGPSLRIPHA